mgnify:CR=1 FL=1
MASTNSIGNRIVNNVPGENAELLIENTSNTANSNAILHLSTQAGAAAQNKFTLPTIVSWSTGLNSSGLYEIKSSTNTAWLVNSDYNITRPSTDAFSATLAGNTAACTGDGTVYNIGSAIGATPYPYNPPSINTRGSFDPNSGIFTASENGIYLLSGVIRAGSVSTAMTSGYMDINYTAGIKRFAVMNGANRSAGTDFIWCGTVFAKMTAGQTAYMRVSLSNSTKTAIVTGSGTMFSGVLLY